MTVRRLPGGKVRNVLVLAAALATASVTRAITITGYSSTANDRFSSGFPLAPVPNANANFIGKDYDWSGVGWSTTTYYASSYKGFAVLSPQHFLTAQHYEYASLNETTAGVRVRGIDGSVYSQSAGAISNLGVGAKLTNGGQTNYDLAIGKLNGSITTPANMARLAVFDLHQTSSADTITNYGLPLFHYGRSDTTNGSSRVGSASVVSYSYLGGDPKQIVLATPQTTVQLQIGDSGAPALYGWTNPNGDKQLTVVALNSYVQSGNNYLSMLATTDGIAAANSVMTPDGFALRVNGPPVATWSGSSNTNINSNAAWGAGPGVGGTSDLFVLFNAATASSNTPNVNTAYNLRGLYFKSTVAANDGFTFAGASTLTIGRGGVTNYDNSRQTFTAPLALGDHQYWDVGSGGVTAGNINNNGKLLEIAGTGTAILSGNVSGSGAVALSGSRLEMTGTSAYTGATWVHSGTLNVSGSIATSSGVRLAAGTRLDGTGRVSVIQGAGSVNPGNSPGILTATSVNPSSGLDFAFELTQTGSPVYGNASASGNDVLRITGGTPFTQALGASNQIAVYFNVGSLQNSTVFRGGIYLDTDTDFLDQIQNASYVYYLADPGGPVSYNGVNYSLYTGPLTFDLSTVASSADFGAGTVNGGVMQWAIVPEPASLSMLLSGAMFLIRRRAR